MRLYFIALQAFECFVVASSIENAVKLAQDQVKQHNPDAFESEYGFVSCKLVATQDYYPEKDICSLVVEQK